MHFFSSIQGNDYVPYLFAWSNSLSKVIKDDDRVTIYCTEIDPHIIRLLEKTYPSYSFHIKKSSVSARLTRDQRVPLKLQQWLEFMESCEIGEEVLLLDVDLVFNEYPSVRSLGSHDLALTVKSDKWPLNTGVIGTTVSNKVIAFFDAWLQKTKLLVSHKRNLAKALSLSGGGSQHTLIDLIGRENFMNPSKDMEFLTYELPFLFESQSCMIKIAFHSQLELNWDKPDQHPTSKIYHYKGGWHPLFMQKGVFSLLRPKDESKYGYYRLETSFQESVAKLNHSVYELLLEKSDTKYSEISFTLEDGGIYRSELLYLSSLIDLVGCDMIIESGRRRACSTEFLAKTFPHIPIISVDFDRNADNIYGYNRVQSLPNVQCYFGDSNVVLPQLVSKYKNKNICLLIDGPKGIDAVKLSKKCLRLNKRVKLVAIHDMKQLNNNISSSARAYFTEQYDFAFFTDHELLTDKSSEYDQYIGKYQDDFHKDYFYQISYGPTLGLAFPTSRDSFISKSASLRSRIKYRIQKLTTSLSGSS